MMGIGQEAAASFGELQIYQCADSVEGIMSAIYAAWASGYSHKDTRVEVLLEEQNLELFAHYHYVEEEQEISEKVLSAVRRKISAAACDMMIQVAFSDDVNKADAIYRFMIRGFAIGPRVISELAHPDVFRVHEMIRNYGNEEHLMKGFLRFREVGKGTLVAVMEPANHILFGLMNHFAHRLNTEDFVIVDLKRRQMGIHKRGQEWYSMEATKEECDYFRSSYKNREEYETLWKVFFDTLEIKERHNERCQRNHCPIWYRKYMTEFIEEK